MSKQNIKGMRTSKTSKINCQKNLTVQTIDADANTPIETA
jgi:hypothetical protein